ncbi:MAG: hypothetical protein ACHQ4H_01490 [Ktedonobacterales bacterium]
MNMRAIQTQTATATATASSTASFQRQVAAIFLMATGWGWTAGNFTQPANTPWGAMADTIHALPLAVLLLLSLSFLASVVAGKRAIGARNGITGLAMYGIVGCAVMVALGLIFPDPNAIGVHTFEDWMPVIVLNAGTLLWLASLLLARRPAAASASTTALHAKG